MQGADARNPVSVRTTISVLQESIVQTFTLAWQLKALEGPTESKGLERLNPWGPTIVVWEVSRFEFKFEPLNLQFGPVR